MFSFSESQLDESIVSVFGSACYEELGISRNTYKLCELIDNNFWDSWGQKVHVSQLRIYGYDTVDDFKTVYAKAQLYNVLRFSPNKTVRELLQLYATKVKRFFNKDIDCNKKNIIDFLNSMSLEELLYVGW
jgi:hypothetical protein